MPSIFFWMFREPDLFQEIHGYRLSSEAAVSAHTRPWIDFFSFPFDNYPFIY